MIEIYRTVIFPVVVYGCETWSLTLSEECRLRVFENRVLKKIFGPKRDEVTGERRRLHNDELYVLYSSPNIIRAIKSRRLTWAEHVARIGATRRAQWGNLRRGNHLEDPSVDERIILKRILEKWYGGKRTGSIWLRIGRGGGLF